MRNVPPAFTRAEVERITEDELWAKHCLRVLKQGLNKDTLHLLLDFDADYLIIDFYDMQEAIAVYQNTFFTTRDYEFFNTLLYRQYKDDIEIANLMEIPTWLWYPYVDLFFEKIMQKYDSEHIILNRFRSNTWYLAKDGKIKLIPEHFKKNYQSNDKYNNPLAHLEEYIIAKFHPYVIDLSKFYMGNENLFTHDISGGHFEPAFYHETFACIQEIIKGTPKKKTLSDPTFFSDDRPWIDVLRNENFDVDYNLAILQNLIDKEDILWLNVLDRLNICAPNDDRVIKYMDFLFSALQE